ncbi:MAG: hypothetical protein WCX31_04445 [Salinivirgaceae bacterium]
MLTLKTNTDSLVIPGNIKISVSTVNSMLVRDRGSNTINFGLQAINSKYLSVPHASGKKRLNEVDVDLCFRSFKKSAKLQYQSLNKELYACNLNFDESEFYGKNKDRSIRTLTLGGILSIWDRPNFDTSDNVNFVFPAVENSKFMQGSFYEETVIGQNSTPYSVTKNFTPFVYLCYLYEQIFVEQGYSIKTNHLRNDIHFKKLVFYTNTVSHYVTDSNGQKVRLNSCLPDIAIGEFINKISDLLNVHPIINESTKEVLIISLEERITRPNIVDITKYMADDLEKIGDTLNTKVVFKLGVETSDELQTPHKYISEQDQYYLMPSVATFDDLPFTYHPGELRLVIDENVYYVYTMDQDTGLITWKKYTRNFQEITLGSGDSVLEIKSDIAAVTSISGVEATSKVEMIGTNYYSEEKGKVPFMLGFAHNANGVAGLWNNSGGDGQIYLNPNSIFNYCWKNTANMMVTSFQPYECTLRIPPAMLSNFDFTAIYKIKSTLFFIEEMNYSFEAEKITYDKSKLRAV